MKRETERERTKKDERVFFRLDLDLFFSTFND